MNCMDTVCTEYSMYWIQYVRTDGQYDKMEIARNNQKEILGIQNSVIEIKNAFDVLARKLDTAKERISELECLSTESLKPKSQKNKDG